MCVYVWDWLCIAIFIHTYAYMCILSLPSLEFYTWVMYWYYFTLISASFFKTVCILIMSKNSTTW